MNTQDKLNEIISLASKIKEEIDGQLTLEGKVIVEIGTARIIVEKVLDQIPETRNDSNLLYVACERIYAECKIPYTKSTQETWRRTAQYYQNVFYLR